ncbi:PrsW family intramembrane metalloprotease [Candidatus Bathyarchaeota archaeon]|nr:PrsW family intramembrane metalloprotease [Candidatus Bathyarchaeota archaeon]
MPEDRKIRDKLDQSFKGMVKEAVISLIDPQQVQLPEVQLDIKEMDHSVTHYIIYGVALLAVGYLVMFGNAALFYFGYIIATIITPVILFAWLYKISPNKYERFPIYILCLGWGAFSGIIASPINTAVGHEYLQLLIAAVVEEPLKILGVYLLVQRANSDSYFTDHLDGFLMGAAAGAGFTAIEDFSKVYQFIITGEFDPNYVLLLRVLTVLGHLFFSAIVGRSLGLAKALKGKVTFTDLFPGLVVAISFHALWNILESWLSLGIMWLFMIFSFRRLVLQAIHDKKKWSSYMEPV